MRCARCGQWIADLEPACAACGAPRAEAAAPAPAAVAGAEAARPGAGVRYGGFWRRLLGLLIDAAVLFFPNAILRTWLGVGLAPWDAGDYGARGQYAIAFQMVLGWLWCALWESSAAQGSPGQVLMGLRVTDLAGRRVSFGRASGRYFGRLVTLLICGTGYLFNLWTSRRQTLHDLISGCVVVRPEPARAGLPAGAGARSGA